MHLAFDSLDDLNDFLLWAKGYGAGPATVARLLSGNDQADKETVSQNNGTSAGEAAPPSDRDDTGNNESDSAAPTAESEAPVKRTRRKKAETEAVEKKELPPALDPNHPMHTDIVKMMVEEVTAPRKVDELLKGNPFAATSDTAEKALDTPEQGATGLTAETLPEVSPIEHLTACQAAIKAHGLEKYNTAFRNDLTANIASYTPEQRALHVNRLSQLS